MLRSRLEQAGAGRSGWVLISELCGGRRGGRAGAGGRAVARDQRACPPTDADDVKKYPARVRVPHRAPPTAYYVYDPVVALRFTLRYVSLSGVGAPKLGRGGSTGPRGAASPDVKTQ